MNEKGFELRTLCVFSIFSPKGNVDSYIDFLLGEIRTVSDDIIIVSNGYLNALGKRILEKYGKVVIRKNQGFDAGAYKDILINFLGKEPVESYDRVILCNDTFFGPLIPFKTIFERMGEKKLDLWGLSILERGLLSHIQSYFLVFEKKIIVSGDLIEYFEKEINDRERDIKAVYGKFENVLYHTFKDKYNVGAYADCQRVDIYDYPDKATIDYGVPVIKIKAFDNIIGKEVVRNNLFNYVDRSTAYSSEYIVEHVKHKYGYILKADEDYTISIDNSSIVKKKRARITEEELVDWLDKGEFYIYGAGITASILYYTYVRYHQGLRGFVVSAKRTGEQELFGYPIFEKKDIDRDSRFVVGVAGELTEEMISILCDGENVLYLWEK